MGMLAAYSGARPGTNRRAALAAAVWFLLGAAGALMILGLVAGLAGQAAQLFLGRFWKLFAGAMSVLFGLGALRLLPVKMPRRTRTGVPQATAGKMGELLGGLVLGGGVAACSLPCNPGIFIIIGTSVLMGNIIWGVALMAAFALGFSLPLATILFGVSLGKTSLHARRVDAAIRCAAGGLLVIAGFYLLATF